MLKARLRDMDEGPPSPPAWVWALPLLSLTLSSSSWCVSSNSASASSSSFSLEIILLHLDTDSVPPDIMFKSKENNHKHPFYKYWKVEMLHAELVFEFLSSGAGIDFNGW